MIPANDAVLEDDPRTECKRHHGPTKFQSLGTRVILCCLSLPLSEMAFSPATLTANHFTISPFRWLRER